MAGPKDDVLGLKLYFYAKYVIRNKARSLMNDKRTKLKMEVTTMS